MSERWTYPKIKERARADAAFDAMFGGSSAYDRTVHSFNKAKDVREYKYTYDEAKQNEEKVSVPRPRRRRGDRGTRG